jgi:ABC-type xylose transport system permease subunit
MSTAAMPGAVDGGEEPGHPRSGVDRLRGQAGRVSLRNYSLIAVLVITWAVLAWLTDGIFLSQRNLTLMSLQSAITGLAAISAVMLIVTRNFDISVGSAVALVGVVVAWMTVKWQIDPLLAIPAALAVGISLGAWNGWWVTRVGVPSFIVTLAGMLIFRGISMIITNGATVSPVPPSMKEFALGFFPAIPSIVLVAGALGIYVLFVVATARRARSLGLVSDIKPQIVRALIPAAIGAFLAMYIGSAQGFPYIVLLLAICALVAEVIMRRTTFGSKLYAIGGNPEAARLAGIDIRRVIFRDWAIAGLMYGIIGVTLTARVSGAVSGSAGLFLELDAIAAAIIGGTSFAGGRGTIFGALLGALLMGSLNNGMSLMNMPTFYQDTARGVVLLIAVAIDVVSRRRAGSL